MDKNTNAWLQSFQEQNSSNRLPPDHMDLIPKEVPVNFDCLKSDLLSVDIEPMSDGEPNKYHSDDSVNRCVEIAQEALDKWHGIDLDQERYKTEVVRDPIKSEIMSKPLKSNFTDYEEEGIKISEEMGVYVKEAIADFDPSRYKTMTDPIANWKPYKQHNPPHVNCRSSISPTRLMNSILVGDEKPLANEDEIGYKRHYSFGEASDRIDELEQDNEMLKKTNEQLNSKIDELKVDNKHENEFNENRIEGLRNILSDLRNRKEADPIDMDDYVGAINTILEEVTEGSTNIRVFIEINMCTVHWNDSSGCPCGLSKRI